MLETCCRPGEILSLQWQDVDLETRELTIRAEKAKTRRTRRLPISSRLIAVLEMRRLDQSGKPFPPDAYVFGNRLGERVKSIRTAWENARDATTVVHGVRLRAARYGGQPSRGLPTVAHAHVGKRERRLVRKRGFEPLRSCERQPLKLQAVNADQGRPRKIGVGFASSLPIEAR
jgi:integrase